MPRLPSYQPNQVGPVETTGARIQAANNNGGMAGAFAEGLQQLGQAGAQAADFQDRLNEENDDTQARLLSAEAGRAYSSVTTEYGTLVGGQARSAQPTYAERLATIRNEALGKATSPRMKRFLEERITGLHAASETQIFSHAVREARTERKISFESQEASYAEQAAAATDPVMRDQLLASGLTVRREFLQFQGIDPETNPEAFAQAELDYSSKVHSSVVDRMFSVPDPSIDEIGEYLAAYGGEMTVGLRNQVLKQLQNPLQDRLARSDADVVMGLLEAEAPAEAPAAAGTRANLDDITMQAESGGRRTGSDGRLLRSPVGAMGEMQVMPATARDPGYGIRPWDGSNLDDLARVGREYRATMERKYGGDLAKMWAAYNWGPGALDGAIRRHGDDWLDHAPAETRAYVLKNVARVGAETATPYANQPQEWDRSQVQSRLNEVAEQQGWSPERLERARREVDTRIQRDEGLLNDQRRDADEAAANVAASLGNGFTSTNQIPRATWETLSPVQRQQYEQIAERNRQPTPPAANGDTVVALHRMVIENPAEFGQLNLEKYRPFMTPGEFDEVNQAQSRARTGRGAQEFDPRSTIDSTITRQKRWSGINVDEDPSEGFRVRRYIEAQASAAQASGKAPVQADYDRWFGEATRTITMRRSAFGFDVLARDREARASTVLSPQYRSVIRREYRQKFGRDPSDAEVQDYWQRMGEPG